MAAHRRLRLAAHVFQSACERQGASRRCLLSGTRIAAGVATAFSTFPQAIVELARKPRRFYTLGTAADFKLLDRSCFDSPNRSPPCLCRC